MRRDAAIACFASFFLIASKKQANRQAELAARDDRDARIGRPFQAEVPRRCLYYAVSNRLRIPLVARSDHTSPAEFGRGGSRNVQLDSYRVQEALSISRRLRRSSHCLREEPAGLPDWPGFQLVDRLPPRGICSPPKRQKRPR